jgi:hypothetical protein
VERPGILMGTLMRTRLCGLGVDVGLDVVRVRSRGHHERRRKNASEAREGGDRVSFGRFVVGASDGIDSIDWNAGQIP